MSGYTGNFNVYDEGYIELCDERLNCAYCIDHPHLLKNLCFSADMSRFKLHLSQLPNTIKQELIILTTSNFSPLFIAGDGRIMDDFHRHHFFYEREAK
jgi:hypothetical protein